MAYYNCGQRNFQSTVSTGHNSNNNNNNNNNNDNNNNNNNNNNNDNNNNNNNVYLYSAISISISVQWCFTTTIIFLKKKINNIMHRLKIFQLS